MEYIAGPGALDSHFLWSVAPATDLVVPALQRSMAQSIATALVQVSVFVTG